MEKKKLLLVAISVGVFLTIVISASILVFSPKTSTGGGSARNQIVYEGAVPHAGTAVTTPRPIAAGTGASTIAVETQPSPQPASVDAASLARNDTGAPNIQALPSATAIQETNVYINGAQPVESYRFESRDGEAAARVTINVPRPTTAAVPDVSYENRSASRTTTETRSAAPAVQAAPAKTAAPATPSTAAAKPAAVKTAPAAVKAAPAAAQPAPAKPAAQAKTYTDYWVQTGAFSAKANAEGVKETLASKGIVSIIENRVVNGATIYQVRVGPYTSENEAKYWLALVQAMPGFSDSLIRQTTSVR